MSPSDYRTRSTLVDQLGAAETSAFQKYQRLYVGNRRMIGFLRYEILTGVLGMLPGSAGFLLRKIFYRSLFSSIGRQVLFGTHVTLRCPGRVILGSHVYVEDHAVLDAKGDGSSIRLGDSTLVGRGSILSCSEGTIEMGDDVSIGPHCFVRAGLGPVKIGSQVTVGAGSVIVSGNPGLGRLDIPMKHQVGSGKGVSIGDDVWVGVGARIIDGVTVGSGCVIGAGAVVTGDIPDLSIAAGVPARIIGSRKIRESI